ncbi:MAG: ParA family protein [Acidaminococcaceae bacterium]|nr:ParA family protein [Acidaminococcaceae bacterium]
MKVISVVNTKGGTGKSTIAVNIAAVLAEKGKKVMLFDMDEKQKSSMDFCRIRAGDKTLPKIMAGTLLPELLVEDIRDYDNFDYVVIDAGAGDNGQARAAVLCSEHGMLLIPVQPSTFDSWAAEDTLSMLRDCQRRFIGSFDKNYILMSRQPTNRNMNILKDADESFRSKCEKYHVRMMESVIHERTAFRESVGEGMGVSEYAKKKPSAKKAAADMENLVEEILGILEEE